MWDLAPQPGIKPWPPVLENQSLGHWITREVLWILFPQQMNFTHALQEQGSRPFSRWASRWELIPDPPQARGLKPLLENMQAWIYSELQDLIFVGNSCQASGSTPQIMAVIVADFPTPLILRHWVFDLAALSKKLGCHPTTYETLHLLLLRYISHVRIDRPIELIGRIS